MMKLAPEFQSLLKILLLIQWDQSNFLVLVFQVENSSRVLTVFFHASHEEKDVTNHFFGEVSCQDTQQTFLFVFIQQSPEYGFIVVHFV